MKSPHSSSSRNSRKRFWSSRLFSGVAACRHAKAAALLAGSSLLATGSVRANSELDVLTTLANVNPISNTTSPLLSATTTYSQGTAPTTASDVTFIASTYAGPYLDFSGPLSIGTINDLSSTPIFIGTGNTGTAIQLTLNGGGDSVTGSNTADLLYVASGSSFTLLPNNNSGTGNLVSLNLGVAGNFDINGTALINAALSGANALTKTGTGTLILAGTNVAGVSSGTGTFAGYSGTITISAGTLQVGNGGTVGSLGTGTGAITDNATLAFNLTSAYTQANAITGTGGLNQIGTGTLTLSGASTYTGPTVVSAGTLSITGSVTGNTTTSSIAVNNATLAIPAGGAATENSVALTGSTLTLGGVLTTNTLSLTNSTATVTGVVAGPGALSLSGASSFSYVPTSTSNSIALSSTTFNAGNATIATNAGNILGLGNVTRAAGAIGQVNFGSAGTITATGTTNTNGILGTYASFGSGTGLAYATLNANNTIVANTGTAAATAAAVTDTTGTVNYDVSAGGAVTAGTSANTVRYLGAAGTISGGPVTLNGLMNSGSGALTVSAPITIGANNELDVMANTQATTISGNIGDGGAASTLTYGGVAPGVLTLSGTNTYTGGTILNAGIVALGSAGAVGTTGAITFNGGTLEFTAANTTDYSSRFAATAGSAFSINTNGQNVTFASSFGGTGTTFAKTGAGTLTLSAANTFGASGQTFTFSTGSTNAGIIVLANPTALGLYSTIAEAGTGSADIVLTGGNTYAYNLSVAGARTGTGLASVDLQNVSGNNTLSGNVSLTGNNPGGIIESDAGTLTINGNFTFPGNTVQFPSRKDFTFTGAGNTTLNGAYNYSYLGLTQAGTGTTTLTAFTAGSSTGFTVNSGTLAFTGTSGLASGNGSFGGLTLGGGTLNYAPTGTGKFLPTSGATVNAGFSAVNVSASNTIQLGAVTRNVGGMLDVNPTGTGTVTTSTTTLLDGLFIGPSVSSGTGTGLSYSTRVATGTVAITPYTAGTAAADATGVTDTTGMVNYNVAAGGAVAGTAINTFRYTGGDNTATPVTGTFAANGIMNAGTGPLTINAALTAGAATAPELVVTSNGQNITLNGVISNGVNTASPAVATASTLTYGGPGAGILTLTAANTYTGTTYVNAGTLLVNGSTSTGAVNVNANATLGGTGTIGGAVAVGQNARITGGSVGTVGTLTVTGALTLSGISGAPATLLVDLNGTSVSHLQIGGALTLSTAAGADEMLVLNGAATPGTYDLANYASIGTGRFDVSSLPTGDTLTYGATELDLTVTAVPEPSTWISGLMLLATAGFAKRRQVSEWLRQTRQG